MAPQPARLPHSRRRVEPPLSRVSSASTICDKSACGDSCSIRSLYSEKTLSSPPQAQRGVLRPSPTEVIVQWTLKVLGVLCAFMFGLWAPISYRLQVTGNRSNDDAQEKLLDKVGQLVERIENVEDRLADLGRLRAVEFCDAKERRTLNVCEALTSSLDIASLVIGLRTAYPKHAPSSPRTLISAPPTTATSTPPLIRPVSTSSAVPLSEVQSQNPPDMTDSVPTSQILSAPNQLMTTVLKSNESRDIGSEPEFVIAVDSPMQTVLIGVGFAMTLFVAWMALLKVIGEKRKRFDIWVEKHQLLHEQARNC